MKVPRPSSLPNLKFPINSVIKYLFCKHWHQYQFIGIFNKAKLRQLSRVKKALLVFSLLLICFQSIDCKADSTIPVTNTFQYVELGKQIKYVSTGKNELTIDSFIQQQSINFIQNKHGMLLLNEDEYKNDLWLTFSLYNETDIEKDLMVQLNNSLINRVEFYEVIDNKVTNSNICGDEIALSARNVNYRTPLYPIHLKAKQKIDIYFKFNLEGRKIHAPIEVYSYTSFVEHTFKEEINLGFFYGLLACLSCICFIVYYLIRERVYFYLAAYFTAQTLLQIAISGVGFVLLWDNSPYWNDKSIPVLMSTCIVLALVFLIEFIQKDKIHRITYIGLRALQLLATLLIFGSFTNGLTFNISVWVLYRIIPVFYIGFFVLSSYFFLTKYLPARFFFISFLLSLISIGGIYYYALTKEHNNVFTNQLVIVGEMLKSIILTLALMDRLRIFKEEKEEAQAQVIVQLEEMNSLKENANKELVQKVEEKTIELQLKQTEVKKALIWGEEQERKRVSQELHDGMGSLLSTLRLNAESIDLNDKGLTEKEYFAYQNVIELIDKACTELRNISHNMMPVGIEQFGLVQQLISIIRKINDSEKVHVVLDTFNMEKRLNRDIELSIYRICLELINNIINHANAKTATLQIIRNFDVLSIVMEDDGVGFNVEEIVEGHGLISIRSRVDAFGGKVNIDSNNNRGTTIIIELPVEV